MTLLAEATTPPPAVWSGDWWSTFTTSPAFAGLMALVAALVAYVSATRRLHGDQQIAAAARVDAERAAELVRIAAIEDRDFEAWWHQFQWTYDRLGALPPSEALRALGALGEAAPSPVAAALVELALTQYGEHRAHPAGGRHHR